MENLHPIIFSDLLEKLRIFFRFPNGEYQPVALNLMSKICFQLPPHTPDSVGHLSRKL